MSDLFYKNATLRLLKKQARIIERELRRHIWKHKVFIDFLIDYIICDWIFY